MLKIFVDSDVILDYFFNREPYSINSSRLFSLAKENKFSIYVTPVIIANVYYILRQTAHDEKVRAHIFELLTFVDIIDIQKDIISKALKSDFKDFEDALQNYACEAKIDIKFILTRNIKDYKNSKKSVLTPQEFLNNFKNYIS